MVRIAPIVSANPEALAERVAHDFKLEALSILASQPRLSWVLTGGQTPRRLYERLSQPPYRSEVPWSQIDFFWGDERCVPSDNPESNYRMAREALLEPLQIPNGQIFRMEGEDNPDRAAQNYERILRARWPRSRWPEFDLMFLGMGTDAHMASLMPGTKGLYEPERWVVAHQVPAAVSTRLTLTLPCINHSKRVWFLIAGGSKKTPFQKVQELPSQDYPASLVQLETGTLRWYVDQAVVA